MIPPRLVVIRPQTVLAVLGLTAAVVLGLLFLYAVRRVLVWALIALVIALALDHVVVLLRRFMPRGSAIAVTYAGLISLVGLAGYLLVPPLVDQVTDFVQAVPDLLEKLGQGRGPLGILERKFDIVERVKDYVDEAGAAGAFGLTQPLLETVGALATTVIAVVSIAFLSLFMLLQGPRWRAGFLELVPEEQRPLWSGIADGIHRAIGGWVIGAVAVAIVAGTSASIVLLALGVPYALALGLVVAVLDPIPFVGATAASTITGLAVLATNGLTSALIFVGFMVGYQVVFENHILVPLVYGRSVELSALSVLLAVLVGGELAGIIGALLAIPVLGSLKAIWGEVDTWRRRERLVPAPGELAAELEERASESEEGPVRGG